MREKVRHRPHVISLSSGNSRSLINHDSFAATAQFAANQGPGYGQADKRGNQSDFCSPTIATIPLRLRNGQRQSGNQSDSDADAGIEFLFVGIWRKEAPDFAQFIAFELPGLLVFERERQLRAGSDVV